MIDKITPRPHEKVKAMLAADGFEDNDYIETAKHTFTAPFVNSEEVQARCTRRGRPWTRWRR